MIKDNYNLEKFNEAVLNREATWWEMELPLGSVFFGDAKTEMLGYQEADFRKYQDFTSLIHPDDYEKTMQDIRDHLSGKKGLYETLYRIRSKNGDYITFYDCGEIFSRQDGKIKLIGFVWKVRDGINIEEQMKDFRDMILNGTPSISDLFSSVKN